MRRRGTIEYVVYYDDGTSRVVYVPPAKDRSCDGYVWANLEDPVLHVEGKKIIRVDARPAATSTQAIHGCYAAHAQFGSIAECN